MAPDGVKRSRVLSAPPRKINVQKFAESRASELDALHSIVSNRLDNDFRSRRNKRRRTTAYDNQGAKKRSRKRRKLGIIGKNNVLESDKDQTKLSRRKRRRLELRRNPENGFSASGDGTKRLRTHVWLAKRFTMKKLWGFYLPVGLQGRGRGSRALLKWLKQGVLVHDASYHVAIQLEGPEGSLMSVLNKLLVPSLSSLSEDISHSILTGVMYGSAMLHHVGAPLSQPIAPVTYMWRPHNYQAGEEDANFQNDVVSNETHVCHSQSRQLWLWIHASAFDEGYNAVKLASEEQIDGTDFLVKCLSLEGQLGKLEVIGSKAFQLLQQTLHSVTETHSFQLKECSALVEDGDSGKNEKIVVEKEDTFSSSTILSFTVKDPRLLLNERIRDVPEPASTIVLNSVPVDAESKHVAIPEISNKKDNLNSSTWPKLKGSTIINQRSLWDVKSGTNRPVDENILCLEKHQHCLDFLCLDEPKSEVKHTSNEVQFSRSCPILLLKNNKKGSDIGWSIILPLSWVKIFWISLASKGAHAIGLREKQWIACETEVPYFPSDFPDCNAYLSSMETEAAASDKKLELRPASIRPFRVPIPSPWHVVRLSLKKVGTGERVNRLLSQKNIFNDTDSSDRMCGYSDMASSVHNGSSDDIIVARTTSVLRCFLKDISGHHLPLFPHLSNNNSNITNNINYGSKLNQRLNNGTPVDSDHKLCFLRVLLHAYKEGVFEEGAVVCAPSILDISLWTSRSESKKSGLEMPQELVRSYFKEAVPGKWELHMAEDAISRESHRWPIGFVTTGFVRGSKKPVAEAFCESVLLARLQKEQWNEMPVKRRRKQIYVLVRNVRSSAYRLALATIFLEQQEEDISFL